MLVDSSVWIDWLQGVDAPATARLDRLLDDGEAWLAPVILQELLQGARSVADAETLRGEFTDQPMLLPTVETYLEAGTLYARCRWHGVTIRSPHDCLIATTAVEHGMPLLTLDRDFDAIAEVEPRLKLVDPVAG
jgi:hypothetical protein